MYHYIRYKDNEFPNFKFLHKKNFLKQLSYFEKKNSFLKIGDNISNFKEKNNKITLTFDDGLKEHFEVAKYLNKKNILGFFFIPTYPYIANDFINPHKLHLILGKYHVDEVTGFLKKILKNLYIINSKKFKITSKDIQMKQALHSIHQIWFLILMDQMQLLSYQRDYKYLPHLFLCALIPLYL